MGIANEIYIVVTKDGKIVGKNYYFSLDKALNAANGRYVQKFLISEKIKSKAKPLSDLAKLRCKISTLMLKKARIVNIDYIYEIIDEFKTKIVNDFIEMNDDIPTKYLYIWWRGGKRNSYRIPKEVEWYIASSDELLNSITHQNLFFDYIILTSDKASELLDLIEDRVSIKRLMLKYKIREIK
jgi:hypothetical protein